ncbi:MAG: hypothetical protein VXB01_16680 [Opitutae bacterium]
MPVLSLASDGDDRYYSLFSDEGELLEDKLLNGARWLNFISSSMKYFSRIEGKSASEAPEVDQLLRSYETFFFRLIPEKPDTRGWPHRQLFKMSESGKHVEDFSLRLIRLSDYPSYEHGSRCHVGSCDYYEHDDVVIEPALEFILEIEDSEFDLIKADFSAGLINKAEFSCIEVTGIYERYLYSRYNTDYLINSSSGGAPHCKSVKEFELSFRSDSE